VLLSDDAAERGTLSKEGRRPWLKEEERKNIAHVRMNNLEKFGCLKELEMAEARISLHIASRALQEMCALKGRPCFFSLSLSLSLSLLLLAAASSDEKLCKVSKS
jgi:hypothetical protein